MKRSLALVLIHDLLFTKRGIPVNSQAPLKQCITRHQARLKAELVKIKIKKGVTSNEELVSQKARDAGKILIIIIIIKWKKQLFIYLYIIFI